jgi:hypothetical protein
MIAPAGRRHGAGWRHGGAARGPCILAAQARPPGWATLERVPAGGFIMYRRVALWVVLLLVATPLLAGDVHIDYDKDFDFSSIHTYTWKDDPKTSLSQDNPYFHDRIIEVVDSRLYRGGAKKVESDPDVYIAYRVSTTTDLSLDCGYFGYTYPGGWYWDPYWNSVWATPNMPSSGRTYTHGTMLIEIWTAATKQLIWRGSTVASVTDDYDKMSNRIFKAIVQLSDKWRDMHEKQMKEAAKAKAKAPAGG